MPSIASDSAKQFASLAKRTGRSRTAERSAEKFCPFNHVEFEFFTRPVTGEIVPGMPTPTVPRAPVERSISITSDAMASMVPR